MQKKILANAFSLNMLGEKADFTLIRVKPIDSTEIPVDAVSCIGHADTARVVGNILGREVPCNRVNVTLKKNDVLYVAQYKGPRLPEGATELPEGATIQFLEVTQQPNGCGTCGAVDCNVCGMQIWLYGK